MENIDSIIKQLTEDYNAADMVVIGVGAELHNKRFVDENEKKELFCFFNGILDKKNYFIITSLNNNFFVEYNYNSRRICAPVAEPENEDSWNLYNKWLSATLNKKLLIIELGEDFNRPNIFRWPFEKIVFINQKSKMYRINNVFYQLPENIGDRAVSVKFDAYGFIKDLKRFIDSSK